ncbi:Tat pathway signal protein, partial [Streptomyces sp. SB3404]|nr:Tat pathway signal protein [Streptomyces boncukensis]
PSDTAGARDGTLDRVAFGDPASEKAHGFHGADTEAVTGAHGLPARVARPPAEPGTLLGELRFTMKADPVRQNFLTLKLWGEDDSTYKTVLLVDGEQANYHDHGDYEAVSSGSLSGHTPTGPLPGRFSFATAMLPLVSTQGRELVEITVRTSHQNLGKEATETSRGYYSATVHTAPLLDPGKDELPPYEKST